jgi:hypothetical protein
LELIGVTILPLERLVLFVDDLMGPRLACPRFGAVDSSESRAHVSMGEKDIKGEWWQ